MILPLLLVAAVTFGACGGDSDEGSESKRPSTEAKIRILAPTADEPVPPDVRVRLELIDGQVVERTTGPLTKTEGHIHLSLDGTLVSMGYADSQELKALPPGPHTLKAEFVAVDHAPFRNRPTASVIFNVAGP